MGRQSLYNFHFPLFFALLLLSSLASAQCIPIEDASKSIGENTCVTGTVLKVTQSRYGHFYLNFCQDYRECPFTVFVPARSLRDVGDVRLLEGKKVEIKGKVVQYRGRAEIVLKDLRQLKGEARKIPPLPKDYDVARKGNFSSGKFSQSKSTRTQHGQPPDLLQQDPLPE